jgi:hypothetical protein
LVHKFLAEPAFIVSQSPAFGIGLQREERRACAVSERNRLSEERARMKLRRFDIEALQPGGRQHDELIAVFFETLTRRRHGTCSATEVLSEQSPYDESHLARISRVDSRRCDQAVNA